MNKWTERWLNDEGPTEFTIVITIVAVIIVVAIIAFCL